VSTARELASCDISAGIGVIIASKKSVACMFTPAQPSPREVYVGSITKFGVDLGATSVGEMIWAVYAPTTRRFGALAGHYVGARKFSTPRLRRLCRSDECRVIATRAMTKRERGLTP
jgi:hypothetical protein